MMGMLRRVVTQKGRGITNRWKRNSKKAFKCY
jgi:hypothetical protein